MELEEILLSPFTTPSTCFSSSPCAGINRTLPFRFATENHVLGLSCPTTYRNSPNKTYRYRTVTHGTVPRDKPSVICVGFAQYPQPPSSDDSNDNDDDKEPIQALVLIDPVCIDQPEDAPPPLRQPSSANTGVPDTTTGVAARDDASVVSVSHSTVVQATDVSTAASSRAGSSSRRPSFSKSENTAASAAGNVLDSSIRTVPNNMGSSGEVTILEGIATTLQPPKARLILQVPTSRGGNDSSMAQEYVALCDFRPLSPCIAMWGVGVGDNNNNDDDDDDDDNATVEQPILGIFVGSADDSRLRFYEPGDPSLVVDGGGRLLVARTDLLPEEHFNVETPVMGIDFHTDGETHTLATVGQDGTIQVISWKGGRDKGTLLFQDISSHRVIVDGPLVSLQIQEQEQPQQTVHGGTIRILIGSLCGYVCHLTRVGSEWHGPTMVIQGLWNSAVQDEDSVLAVHAFGDCIALGTLSGRCLIYQAALFGQQYYKLWECTLPYSIHGLEVRPTTSANTEDGDSNSFDLIVLTRRSLHVFRPKRAFATSLPRNKYSVQAAKDRLQSLLRVQQPEPDDSSPEVETTTADDGDKDGEDGRPYNLERLAGEVHESSQTKPVDDTNVEVAMDEEGNDKAEASTENHPLEEEVEQVKKGECIEQDQSSALPSSQELSLQSEEAPDISVQERVLVPGSEVVGALTNNNDLAEQDDEQWILISAEEGATEGEKEIDESSKKT